MPTISGMLNIGLSALLTQQKGIDITGNNIANVNTPGYSRQRLNIEQNDPVRDQNTISSTGVYASPKIQRFYDQFIASQMNNENSSLGRWQSQKAALGKVEVLFDETSGYGLSDAMSQFWSAWQDLANNPSGQVERTSLVSAGQYLSTTFNQISSNIEGAQKDINANVASTVSDINQIASQIADLNGKIAQVEVSGQSANDYRDQRDQLAFNLSELIDINSFEDARGNLTITVGGGKPLVESTFTWKLSTADSAGTQTVEWQDSSGNSFDITDRIAGGGLQGWIQARDDLNGYNARLDTLAGSIISEVNAVHRAGFNLNGTQNDFFEGSAASTISVASAIEADTNLIAAAGSAASLPGDNSTALAIADLQNRMLMSGNTATFDDYYTSLVGDIGNDVNDAGVNFDHQTNMVQYLQNAREEVSGVSLDEESVNLIQFQHAYSAAARLITTVDEMMDTLINMLS